MTKERFHKIREAARELLRLRDEGAQVRPDMIEWAEGLLKTNAVMPRNPFKHSPNHDKITAVLQKAPPDGYTYRQVANLTEMDERKACVTLNYMSKVGKAFMLKRHKNTRYFADQASHDAGRALLDKAKAPAWSTRNKPKPKPHQTMQIKGRPADPPPGPRKPTIDESIFNPHGIKPTVIPTPVDNRFSADPNSEGAGFMAEWRKKRGIT